MPNIKLFNEDCELDLDYYQAACQRFKLATAQTTLFDEDLYG